jgi:hypothetical protein
LIVIVSLVFYPVAAGSSIRLASEEIEKGQANLGASVRFAISRLVWIWALSLIVGVLVSLGLVALIVPGIILGIMFSLALPALLIGNTGVLESLGRSRQLVSHRWLKTFAIFLVFFVIIAIASIIVSVISRPFGDFSTIVSDIISAFYAPLIPIALTVFYYSNVARVAQPQGSQAPMAPAGTVRAGMKFCPKCGTALDSSATVCTSCGAPQRA